MPPKVDPIILPPLRTYDRTGATRAAYSTQPSSNPLPTASTLFFQPATQSLVPSDVAAATPTQPPSPWYPLPFNPFIGEDTPSASIAASPTGRDYLPHTGPEVRTFYHPCKNPIDNMGKVERSSRDDEGGGVALSGGNPAAAATGNFPGFHVPQRAFSTPSIQAYDSRNEGPRFSTSAHPLPHPGASSEAGKNIWDPDWLFQPQEKWNEHLRRLSTATVSPGTLATGGAEVQEQRAPQAIEPNVLAPGPTVDVRAQGAASSRQRNTTSRPSPPDHNLLTSYLQVMAQSAALRKTKTRARRTRRVKESSSAGNEGSNLPAGSQQEPGNDDEIGEGATSSNAGSASDATTGVTLPSFSRFIESAGLHQDMLPGYQWDPRGLSVREQRFLASTTNDQGGYEPFAPAGPLLDRRPLNLSAAGRDGLGNRTNSEAESTPEVDKPDTPAPMHIDTTQVVYPPDQTMSIVDQPKPARYSVETTHDPHLLPYRSVYPSVFQAQRQSQPPSFTPPQNSLHASSILSSASQIVPSPSQNQPRLSEPYPPSVVEQGRPKSRHSQFISTEDYGHVDHGSTHGYGANQGYGTTQSYNATQAYGATESHSVTQGYGSAQVYGSNSGQGVYEGSQEQGRRAPEYTYGQGSYANPPQSNVLRTGQGYGRNPFSNPQPQGRQRPQQQQPAYTHGQGNHNSYSARHPHPSVIPLHIPPNWNQQPGTYAASQAPYSAVPQIQPQPATYAPRALPLSGYPPFVAPYPVLPPFNIPAPTYRTHRARAAYNFRASHRLPVPPSLPIHRYRPGGDTMYPQSNGGASVAYQELTRRGRPSFAMGTRAENLPFVETARPARPARWGVAKIGNVSRQ